MLSCASAPAEQDPPVPARLIALSDHHVDPLLFNQQRLLQRSRCRQGNDPLPPQTLDLTLQEETK